MQHYAEKYELSEEWDDLDQRNSIGIWLDQDHLDVNEAAFLEGYYGDEEYN